MGQRTELTKLEKQGASCWQPRVWASPKAPVRPSADESSSQHLHCNLMRLQATTTQPSNFQTPDPQKHYEMINVCCSGLICYTEQITDRHHCVFSLQNSSWQAPSTEGMTKQLLDDKYIKYSAIPQITTWGEKYSNKLQIQVKYCKCPQVN